MLTITGASLLSTTLQSMLYGFSLTLFFLTFWILIRNGRARRRYNYVMLAATTGLLVFSTLEWVLSIIRLLRGVVNVGPKLPTGIEGYFSDASRDSWFVRGSLYTCQTLILDAMVIYRAYVVWQNFYVVIAPLLGWIGLAATMVGVPVTVYQSSKSDVNAESLFTTPTGKWVIVVYAVTLGTNLLATTLLAIRIWRMNNLSEVYLPTDPRSSLKIIFRVIIESGAIYSFTIITSLVAFATGSIGVYVIIDMVSPIICIVFNMIIVRVGFATDKRITDLGGSARYRPTGLKVGERHPTTQRSSHKSGLDTNETNPLSIELMHYVDDADAGTVRRQGTKSRTGFNRSSVHESA